MIAVIDYGMGNLQSVANAFEAVGAKVNVCTEPRELDAADRIVLPGVGAFGEAIRRLRDMGMVGALEEAVIHAKKPFLGICLGMQLLAERSFEHGEHAGLGWMRGSVRKLEPRDALRVPHMGWNDVKPTPETSPLFQGLPAPTFYFVHSFWFDVEEPATVAATSEYGGEFVVAVSREHVFGTQFHPEKSHHAGLALLRNFLSYGA